MDHQTRRSLNNDYILEFLRAHFSLPVANELCSDAIISRTRMPVCWLLAMPGKLVVGQRPTLSAEPIGAVLNFRYMPTWISECSVQACRVEKPTNNTRFFLPPAATAAVPNFCQPCAVRHSRPVATSSGVKFPPAVARVSIFARAGAIDMSPNPN